MSVLGKQGLHIIRQAAKTAAEIERDQPPPPSSIGATSVWEAPASRLRPKRRKSAPLPIFDRDTLRARLDVASVRPAPGSSDLLSRPLSHELVFGYTQGGKLSNEAEVHDLTAMAPIHLKRREEE